MNNLSQRDVFWGRIYDLARQDPDIIILSADMGAPSLDRIRRDLASQYVGVGIAEQNAITIASGLAMAGKRVFVYAIAPFITLRCLEQIRVENAIMKIPVTIVGVGAGFGYDESGPTHHIIEDICIMRSMPHITINSISDNIMASCIADISCSSRHTNYVRLDRQPLPVIYKEGTSFTAGLEVLRRGEDLCIIGTGCMTHKALKVADLLESDGIHAQVIDLYTFPINEVHFLEAVKDARMIVTLEEHFLPGGLGSAVCETLIDNQHLVPVKRIGLSQDKGYCYEYGGRDIIHEYYGIDDLSIINSIHSFLNEGHRRESIPCQKSL